MRRVTFVAWLSLSVACDQSLETDKVPTASSSESEVEDTGCDTVVYVDMDQDGFGDADSPRCPPCSWCVADATDCDDADSSVFPGAVEICDALDNDCDTLVDDDDDDVTGQTSGFIDADGDGFGDPEGAFTACEPPAEAADNGDDCDDEEAADNPDADEACDERDNDCDTMVDEGVQSTFYADADGDGFGADPAVEACAVPSGYVSIDGDCDDEDDASYPDAEETCDLGDNDCDEVVDEDAVDEQTFFLDRDGDGYGRLEVTSCFRDSGLVDTGGDCDDADTGVHPGMADSSCDNRDDDCDGSTDEASPDFRWYFEDADGDGYGQVSTGVVSCIELSGYAEDTGDCDDGDATTHIGAEEVCDTADNDCDGTTDEDVDWFNRYEDGDGDGYGPVATVVQSCALPSGWTTDTGDCDDSDATAHVGAEEVCDTGDNDCDGLTDEGFDRFNRYEDSDGDGYGAVSTVIYGCELPSGWTTDTGDCDDSDPATHLGATETCDTGDQDCDGQTEEGVGLRYYPDADLDGYASSSSPSTWSCVDIEGWVTDTGDCDDSDASANPGATEACDTGDEDCDGLIDEGMTTETWYLDDDGDGYGTNSSSLTQCAEPSGYVLDTGDCDDDAVAVHPGMTERCNGVDDDCDGSLLAAGESDGDGDGALACEDCDDSDPAFSPYAPERFDTGDNDCDGTIDEGVSSDGDGDGWTATDGDCDDRDPFVNPDATELCDDLDQDCDGTTDEDATCCADTGESAFFVGDTGITDVSASMTAGSLSLAGDGDLLLCNGDWTADIELLGSEVRVHGESTTLRPSSNDTITVATDDAAVRVSGITFEDCVDSAVDASSVTGVRLGLHSVALASCADSCISVDGDLWLAQSSLDSCEGTTYGGGAYVTGDAFVTDSAFDSNGIFLQSGAFGGSLYVGGSARVHASTFVDSRVTPPTSTTWGGYNNSEGADLFVVGDLVAYGLHSEGAYASCNAYGGYGTQNYCYGGSLRVGGEVSLTASTIEDAIIIGSHNSTITSYLYGGAIVADGDVVLERSQISDSYVYAIVTTTGAQGDVYVNGGAIYTPGVLSLVDSDLLSNRVLMRAGNWTGDVRLYGGAAHAGSISLEGSVIRGNYGDRQDLSMGDARGGALYTESLSCTDSDLVANGASDDGGAVWLLYSDATSDGCDWGEDRHANEPNDLGGAVDHDVDGQSTFHCDTGGCDTGL